ncbi:MAG: hypothetical protein JNK92_13595 [Dechloromonas sp.]|nr:hypothetical protein [Dechloromonas sp.]
MAEYIKVTPENLLMLEQECLPMALKGDYEAVKLLLRVLSFAIEQGVPLPLKLAGFLAGALRDISRGGSPGNAFCIKRKRGERDVSKAIERAVNRVFMIKMVLHENPGMSIEVAIAQVAEKEGAPEDTVKAAWRDYRNGVILADDGGGAYVFYGKIK